MLSVEKKNPGWALVVKNLILFSSVWNDLFSYSQGAAQSLDMFLLLLIPSRVSPVTRRISSPSSGPLVFQFQAGRLLLRPSGICSAARSFFTWTSRRGSGRQQPLFPSSCTIPFSPGTSSPSRFTSLFLFWGRISASFPLFVSSVVGC